MSIEVTCVQCGSSHHVNNRLAGRRVRCPNCDTAVHVPELEVNLEVDPSESEQRSFVEVEPIAVEVEPVAVEVEPIAAAPMAAAAVVNVTQASGVPQTAGVPQAAEDDDEDDEVLPRKNRPEEEMDMTPMVDVTFLLLIFFMVTAAFSLQKSIEMPRQQTDAPSTSVVGGRGVRRIGYGRSSGRRIRVFLGDGTRLGTRNTGQTKLDHCSQGGHRGQHRRNEAWSSKYMNWPSCIPWWMRWMPAPSPATRNWKSHRSRSLTDVMI